MKASQARSHTVSASALGNSRGPIPATASAHKAVQASAAVKASRGTASPARRIWLPATTANSKAASAWLHRMVVASMRLPRARRKQHDADRLEENQQIEEWRVIFGVIEIVFELLPRILDRRAIGIVDLRPAGNPRLHHVALGIIRQLLLEIVDELRALRTWADEAHLAFEDAPGLRQFIDAELADDAADARDSRIVLLRPHGLAGRLGIRA